MKSRIEALNSGNFSTLNRENESVYFSHYLNRDRYNYFYYKSMDSLSLSLPKIQRSTEAFKLPPLDFSSSKPSKLPSLSEVLSSIPSSSNRTNNESNFIKLILKQGSSSLTPSPLQTFNPENCLKQPEHPYPMKRPRRLHHQVTRIYSCNYMGCKKSYGALNHLNSHILSQGHGHKRRAYEFYHLTRP